SDEHNQDKNQSDGGVQAHIIYCTRRQGLPSVWTFCLRHHLTSRVYNPRKIGSQQIRRSSMLSGFKRFMMRGNVIDLAVAVVIGAAFGAVVTALVKDLITPM